MRTSLFVSLLFIANSLGGVSSTVADIDSTNLVVLVLMILACLDTTEVLGKTK